MGGRSLWRRGAIAAVVGLVAPFVGVLVSSGSTAGAASTSPLLCSVSSVFLAQGAPTSVLALLYGSGATSFSPIGTAHGWAYNALGYDTIDHFLYAVSYGNVSPPGHLLRIDSLGDVTDLGVISGDSDLQNATGPAGQPAGAWAGAFDGAGNFYVMARWGLRHLDEIDVTSTPPAVVSSIATTPQFTPLDFTWASGFLWGMGWVKGTNYIDRLDPTNGTVTSFVSPVQTTADSPLSYGAAWTYANGDLGFSSNKSGTVYSIGVSAPSSAAPTFTLVSSLVGPIPPRGNNDGASCAAAAVAAPPLSVDLAVAKTGPATAAAGSSITWQITVTNNGPDTSSGFAVDDVVPAGVTSVSTTTPGCTVTGSTLHCTEGSLASGQTFTVVLDGLAPTPFASCISNTATVTGNESDPDATNNTSTAVTCPPAVTSPGGGTATSVTPTSASLPPPTAPAGATASSVPVAPPSPITRAPVAVTG